MTAPSLDRIVVHPGLPYFTTEAGRPWTPIGHNDAVTWPDLAGLFRRRDLPAVERHLEWLKAHGVTCIRLMLEYCHHEHRYLEKPVGRFVPNMVRLWDDLFAMLERVGLRVLLTPYDTFFMWIRWRDHPYNRKNGGPCARRSEWLTCPRRSTTNISATSNGRISRAAAPAAACAGPTAIRTSSPPACARRNARSRISCR